MRPYQLFTLARRSAPVGTHRRGVRRSIGRALPRHLLRWGRTLRFATVVLPAPNARLGPFAQSAIALVLPQASLYRLGRALTRRKSGIYGEMPLPGAAAPPAPVGTHRQGVPRSIRRALTRRKSGIYGEMPLPGAAAPPAPVGTHRRRRPLIFSAVRRVRVPGVRVPW